MKNLTNNDLHELDNLMGEITKLINNDYIHVKSFLPKSVISELTKFDNNITREITSRGF